MKAQIIECDPPWTYEVWADKGQSRNASAHYDLMDTNAIKALPVLDIADRAGCLLFLWVTGPLLDVGIACATGWGFKYVTIGFNWVKRDRKNSWFRGNGHYTRANSELCLIFKIGDTVKRQARNVSQIVSDSLLPEDFTHGDLFTVQTITDKRRHSAKPLAVYDELDRMYPDETKVRLFARDERPGWYSYGDEITGNDIRIDMKAFAEMEEK